MANKKNYDGLDVLKFVMALLVVWRHVIQIFYGEDSRWRVIIGSWLSNLPVPVFFTIAGFFLFKKYDEENPDRRVLFRYCGRILRLYLLWSVLYLPVDLYNWFHAEGHTVRGGVLTWLHHFLFDSTIPQLWYLPALAAACFLVWSAYRAGAGIRQLLFAGLLLFAAGTVGNNWYFNQRLPMAFQDALAVYNRYFITLRNGVFYGVFFVALGLMLAKTDRRPPLAVSVIGAVLLVLACGWEASRFSEVNFVFLTAPAAYFLFSAAERFPLPGEYSRLYPRLRAMSEWIYFSHFYFFHILVWTRNWNPVPFTSKTITAMILGVTVLFSWCMVRLSGTRGGRFLKKLI